MSQIDTARWQEEPILAPWGVCAHAQISISSVRPTEFIDITDRVQALVASSGVWQGTVNVQALHTTTAVLLNEHEPLLLTDFEALLSKVAPIDAVYRHDDPHLRVVNVTAEERTNGHAHCRALFLAPSICLNVAAGRLVLGRWQRLFFVDLDGPRERHLSTMVMGDGARR